MQAWQMQLISLDFSGNWATNSAGTLAAKHQQVIKIFTLQQLLCWHSGQMLSSLISVIKMVL